jgi:uncharacterized protein YllA (UPF0747 family)
MERSIPAEKKRLCMAKIPENLTLRIGISKETIREIKRFHKEVDKIMKKLSSLGKIIKKNHELILKSGNQIKAPGETF